METTLIDPNIDSNGDLPLKSEAQSFLIANGVNHTDSPIQMSDIEMVALQPLSYISLKDLLPVSPPSIMSPTYNRRESWREIPIKDPLVQHAAWAYLQPMSRARVPDGRSCATKLKDKCGGLFGCFGGFLNDVVWKTFKRLVSKNENVDEDEDEDEEEEDDHRRVD